MKLNLGPDGPIEQKSMDLNTPARVAKFIIKLSSQVTHFISKAFISLLVLFNLHRFELKALILGFRQLFDQFDLRFAFEFSTNWISNLSKLLALGPLFFRTQVAHIVQRFWQLCVTLLQRLQVCVMSLADFFLALFVFTMVLLNIFQSSKIGQINEKLVINSIFKS